MLHLCRTCHGETAAHNCIAINDDNVTSARIKSQLLSCVPELQEDLVKEPVMCSTCVEALNLTYAFKVQCLETDERIQYYFQNTTLIATNVTLLELYREFGETRNFVKLEDLTVKLSNSVACNDADDVANTKNVVVVHEVPIPKEQVYDIHKGDINDLKNNFASEVNQVNIVKEECEFTQFKVDEDNFKKDSSDNELEKLEGSTKVEDGIQEIATSEIELKELCLSDKASENTRESDNRTWKCFVKLVRIEDLRNPTQGSNRKINQTSARAEKRYTCSMCTYTTWKRSVLVNHVRIHSDKKYFQCVNCEFCTYKSSDLTRHMRTHTGEKPYRCNFCEFRSAQKGYLKSHMRTHTGEKPFQCTICAYRTGDPSALKKHTKTHSGETRFEDNEIKTEAVINEDIVKEECDITQFKVDEDNFKYDGRSSDELEELEGNTNVQERLKVIKTNEVQINSNKKSFQCDICDFHTAERDNLNKHMSTHTRKKPFQCTICKFRTADRSTLKKHTYTHTGEKPLKCTSCEFRTARRSALTEHIRIHTGEKPFQCTSCEFCAISRNTLKQHMKTHTGEKPFQCNICKFCTIARSALKEHMRTHTGEKPFQCTICKYRSARGISVRHMRIHTGEKPFECTICKFCTVKQSALNEHMKTHTSDKPFQCSICKFCSAYRKSLIEHMRSHTGEKPYQCTFCKFRTTSRRYLNQHRMTHTGEKPFQCTICEFRARDRSCMTRHIRTHTGEKPFQCAICGFRTASRSTLKRHTKIHTSEKDFQCTICDFCATSRKTLDQHMRTHTG